MRPKAGTGALVATAVDRRVGGSRPAALSTDSSHDVREVYRSWAKQFSNRLCTEGGTADCTPPGVAEEQGWIESRMLPISSSRA